MIKNRKKVPALFLCALLGAVFTAPAYASAQPSQNSYTVPYSQVEQMVLNHNLQVDSNELTIGSMDSENKLKEKYGKISSMISQVSASLNAIINNPQSTADLKTVAQGTNVTLSALSSLLNAQEDFSDDDYELTEIEANLSNNQLVKSAQSLFSVYYQLQYNIRNLTDKRAVL
ncbi:MAG TPA: hypothetical protein VHO71_01030, partial [Caproiciproducens sp.]|nr:hypothetical protein [Caproiciproducens sp.]